MSRHNPASDALIPSPLLAASRDQPVARGRWRQASEEEVQACPEHAEGAYPIGYFHVDLAEVRTEQGKLCLLVAIDRTSKFAFVELHEKATRRVAGDFLRHLAAAVPYTRCSPTILS